jgi:hypothetical protein
MLQGKLDEARNIIEKISKLKYHMGRDHLLEYVSPTFAFPQLLNSSRPIPADGELLVEEYNMELKRLTEAGKGSWFTAPWLFAE